MDKIKAEELFKALRDKEIEGWKIVQLKDFGKSAAVFEAHKGAIKAAVKVFDQELIERYGDNTQVKRIERELSLKGKAHPNMVEIYGGGKDIATGCFYVIMQFLDGPNLKDNLASIPSGNIPMLVEQLASACEFLESHQLVHRDIKPANIIVLDNFTRLILLDFGVIRPIGQPGLTDGDGIWPFIGTLQYSSPEFLLREEKDDITGWRALTFYQIGAVMHDLLTGNELFKDQATPYARLVNAVQHTTPPIQTSTPHQRLVSVAKTCLLKKPSLRTDILSWSSFARPKDSSQSVEALKKQVLNRISGNKSLLMESVSAGELDSSALLRKISDALKASIRRLGLSSEIFPKIKTIVREPGDGSTVVVRFISSEVHGLPKGLAIKFSTAILDAAAEVVQIGAVSTFADGEAVLDSERVFRGPLAQGPLNDAIEETAYLIIDAAQQRSSSSGA